MVQTKRGIGGSPLEKNTTQYGEMSSDWWTFDVRCYSFHGDYPRLTHDIIGRGINPLYMSYFIATHPLIVLERKRKHRLLSILSGNMLSNIQLKALDARYIRAVKDNPTNICLPKENTHTR